jgi:hypothetical protein
MDRDRRPTRNTSRTGPCIGITYKVGTLISGPSYVAGVGYITAGDYVIAHT